MRENYGRGVKIERSPGHWQITVELGRDPATKRRRRERFTFIGKAKDAEKALRAALTRRDNGLGVASDKITMKEWLERWLARHEAEGHVGARAHDRYRRIIAGHLSPALGSLRVQALRSDHITDLKASWLNGTAKTCRAPLAGATVHKHLVVLRQALADAVKAGIIARNPADVVSAPSVKVTSERRALTEDEIAELLRASAGTRYDAPIRLTLASGLREGELLGLRWSDIDFDAGVLHVRRNLQYVAGKLVFAPPKTDRSRRTVELSPATIALLRAHRLKLAEDRLRLGPVWKENGLAFPSSVGTPWLPRTFYRDYRRVIVGAAIDDAGTLNWHALRHTAASQWIRRGADIFSVSRRLGHASASFTMDVYGHLLKGQQRQAAEALDHLIAQ